MASLKNIPGKSALYRVAASNSALPRSSKGIIVMKDCGVSDKINLRCKPDNTFIVKALERVIGTTLPTEANRFNASGLRSVVWCGPDEWLLLAESGVAEIIIAALDNAEAGHVAVTNVSDSLGGLNLSGPHARDVLAKHCALDFHASAFTPGMAQQSLLSHAGVNILCQGENEFLIIGRTSFMPYIASLMMDAAIEYGYEYNPAE
jgi:sarcosine oxidase subunit gamma